ncbi:gluconate 5-dehydrogenase [Falsiroseomonas bella]|uniref:Gluconate 5-dehydrogenase n=1 Tax=Falsiroseomonas bella TaxID=2184016 RepID=A0A317F7Y2_9PROT|nr:SDR family oxidoreductase [Falsiroseomonas bella]PWS34513.1 gluconate 5-dehydrogenase [Falsiroseomonas bella]
MTPILARFSLEGRVALVTGGSSGIGLAIAEALHGAGASVVLCARRADALRQAAETLSARAAACLGDVADRAGLADLAARAAEPFGAPEIVVHAAGLNARQPWDQVDDAAWNAQIESMLAAPFFLSRALLPGMRAKGRGRVLNIASLQSTRAMPDSIPYGAAKGGVAQLTRAMAEAWGRYGITCNAIAPGFFPTALTAPVFADAERAARLAAQTCLGRNGRLEDLQGAAVFLASDAAAYVTGQVLAVDGGFLAK